MKSLIAVSAALVLLVSIQSAAAQGKPRLRIIMEVITQETIACGLQQSPIESIAALTLRNNGVQVSSDFNDPYLYVTMGAYQVTVGGRPVGCAARFDVSIRGYSFGGSPIRGFKPRIGVRPMVLCEGGRLITDEKANLPSRVMQQIEEEVKICLGDLDF